MKIVVADSDPRVRALIKLTLSSYQSVQVFEASDADETSALVQYVQPDVLIVDENLMSHDTAGGSPNMTILQMIDDAPDGNVINVSKQEMVSKAQQRLTAFLPEHVRRGANGHTAHEARSD